MKTINESAVVTGATLQIEMTNGIGTPVVAVACPAQTLSANSPVYAMNLRGYAGSFTK